MRWNGKNGREKIVSKNKYTPSTAKTMNVLSEMTAASTQKSTYQAERVTLGQGNDLDPRFLRWCISGGIGGFLVWSITSVPAIPLHELLHQRGPTQIITLIMSGMLLAFLVSKWRRLSRQEKGCSALEFDIVNLNNIEDIGTIRSKLEQDNYLINKRIRRVLDVWGSTGSSFQLERSADTDNELFELSMISSYSFPKVLLWAIPLTGFIGTVIGMSQAVGSFDVVLSNADNVDGLKDGLVQVTGGLGTAFDTTFLALVSSVILAFPLSVCEKKEDQLLSQIDGVVRDMIMTLSPTGEDAGRTEKKSLAEVSPDTFDGNLNEAISDAFEKHLPDPSVLVEPARAYADAITEASVEKLGPLTQLVRDSVEGVSEARLSLQEQSVMIQKCVDILKEELTEMSIERKSKSESSQQLQAIIELRQSMERLNSSILENKRSSLTPKNIWESTSNYLRKKLR